MHGCQDPLLNTKTAPTHQRGSSCTSVRLAMDTSAVSLTAHAAPVVNIVRGHIKRAACRFRTRWLSTHAHTHTHTHTHTHGCTLALVNAKFMRAHIHTHAHSMMSTLVHQDSQRGGSTPGTLVLRPFLRVRRRPVSFLPEKGGDVALCLGRCSAFLCWRLRGTLAWPFMCEHLH